MATTNPETSSTTINIGDDKAKSPSLPPPPPPTAASKATFFRMARARGGSRRCLSVMDFLLRIVAIGATLAAAVTMGTTNESLPFFTPLFRFQANYDDMPAFTFFLIGNAIAGGYLVLSLCYSMVSIIRPRAAGPRLLLLIFDTVMVALTTASASSAAAIVYLAHNGNASANWVQICQQFQNFCQRTSGAVIASFIAVVVLILLVFMSALALRRHSRQ
ncbi:hypothetical protein QJS10_CPA08g01400 [Acorus calamus]|uniref:CASP-like protein n=1 Tax=Acorus calamus TaxID=4465 RepID=A0AAV9EBZ8_ACOCL|nr:hypothetical protein QJS10_CPA08g01400 [Acorus calamus]